MIVLLLFLACDTPPASPVEACLTGHAEGPQCLGRRFAEAPEATVMEVYALQDPVVRDYAWLNLSRDFLGHAHFCCLIETEPMKERCEVMTHRRYLNRPPLDPGGRWPEPIPAPEGFKPPCDTPTVWEQPACFPGFPHEGFQAEESLVFEVEVLRVADPEAARAALLQTIQDDDNWLRVTLTDLDQPLLACEPSPVFTIEMVQRDGEISFVEVEGAYLNERLRLWFRSWARRLVVEGHDGAKSTIRITTQPKRR
ncbi:MAG: hypothetical protein H6739_14370 [Alphaproteobacteria bacterium]|nr:hypothetical protein [Alphaproteobacteria bacterium]